MERVICFFLGHKEDPHPLVIEAVKVLHTLDGATQRTRATLHVFRCDRCGSTAREAFRSDGPRRVIDAQVEDESAGA